MQNVNLHRAQYPPKAAVKVSRKLSIIVIIICISIIAVISLTYWKIGTLKDEYSAFINSSSLTKRAMDKIKKDLNTSASEDNLKIDLLNIKDKLKHKQALKNKLDEESNNISTSFYKRFSALSKQDIKGLWLTKISFLDKGKNLVLIGNAQNPELVSKYIQKLSDESIFSGLTFELLQIDNINKKRNGIIRFIITSDLKDVSTPLQKALNEVAHE